MDRQLSQKDLRIRKCWERGMRDLGAIAKKIGYGGAMAQGIERVREGLIRLGLEKGPTPNDHAQA